MLGYAIFPSHLFWGLKINVRYLFVPHIWSTMNYTYLRSIIWFGHNYITIKPSPHTRWQTSITSESSLIHLYNSLSFLFTPWKICFLTLTCLNMLEFSVYKKYLVYIWLLSLEIIILMFFICCLLMFHSVDILKLCSISLQLLMDIWLFLVFWLL